MRKVMEDSSLATTNIGHYHHFKKTENAMRITESKAAVMKTRLYASEEGNEEYPLPEIMVFINTWCDCKYIAARTGPIDIPITIVFTVAYTSYPRIHTWCVYQTPPLNYSVF